MLEPPLVRQPPTPEPRRRLLDNPRVLAALFVIGLAIMAGLFWLSGQTTVIAPQLLTDRLLYVVVALAMALLVALVFVLARNLIKLWVERRQAAPIVADHLVVR